MKKFDESKHPRDKEGKFTNKNTSSSSVATKEKESNEYTEKVKKYKEKIQFQKESTDFGRNIDNFLNGKIKDSFEIKVLQVYYKNMELQIIQSLLQNL